MFEAPRNPSYLAYVNSPSKVGIKYVWQTQSGTAEVSKGSSYSTPIGYTVYFPQKGHIHVHLSGNSNNQPKILIVDLGDQYYVHIVACQHHEATNTGWASWLAVAVSDDVLPNLPDSVMDGDSFFVGNADFNASCVQFWDVGRYVHIVDWHGNFAVRDNVRIYPVYRKV